MELRTAYCLNALFQRRNATRLLNTPYTRINSIMSVDGHNTRVVHTPFEASEYLSKIMKDWPSFRHSRFGYDSQLGTSAIEFVIKGMLYDRPCLDKPCEKPIEHAVEAVMLKFFDQDGPSKLSLNETFLKGMVHFDVMPDMRGPTLPAFISILHQAGETWNSIDFLNGLPCKARRLASVS